jgi:hypothetical protein
MRGIQHHIAGLNLHLDAFAMVIDAARQPFIRCLSAASFWPSQEKQYRRPASPLFPAVQQLSSSFALLTIPSQKAMVA